MQLFSLELEVSSLSCAKLKLEDRFFVVIAVLSRVALGAIWAESGVDSITVGAGVATRFAIAFPLWLVFAHRNSLRRRRCAKTAGI